VNARGVEDVDYVVEEAEYTETKDFFRTSEFWIALIGVVGVLLAAYSDGGDSISREDGWRYATALGVGYVVSRGLAKAGTREPKDDG
jgi:hypothetical protein